jgi:hypothetical protein
MITNIIVLASIILVAIFVAAYKSKRQVPPSQNDHEHDEPVDASIISENVSDMQPSGSIETVGNDTSSNAPISS